MEVPPRKRVKLYELSDSNEWIDKGTGECSCIYVERKNGSCIIIRSEVNGLTLLESKILSSTTYQRQQETLIVWTEPNQTDYAISFQEQAGCNDIWDQIHDLQKTIATEVEEELPKPEMGNLQAIELAVHHLSSHDREKLISNLLSNDYYAKLLDLFEMSEDLENEEGLHSLFYTFKIIMMLNNRVIYEALFKNENILKIIGILEHDPELGEDLGENQENKEKVNEESGRIKHRERVCSQSLFKQFVPLPNKDMEDKIHQTYRLQYLKNHVLPRPIDESTYSVISQMIYSNYLDIVSSLQSDDQFLGELFSKLQDPSLSVEKKREGIEFLQEFCSVSKNIQENKPIFFRSLRKHGLMEVIVSSIQSPDLTTRIAIVNVIFSIFEFDSSILRNFILGQKESPTLLGVLINQLSIETDVGMKTHLTEIIRNLLDSDNMETTNATEKAEFLGTFYDKYLELLIEPLKKLSSADTPLEFNEADSYLYNYLCELLSYFAHQHLTYFKPFILRFNIVGKLTPLLRSKQKFLVLSTIRFIRAVLGTKDETLLNYLIQQKLFEPLLKVFESNKTKNNLINSAILECFEFIRQENLKKVISYLVENDLSYFEGVTYVDTFRLLVSKNEQNKEYQNGFGQSSQERNNNWQNFKRKRDDRGLDEDEEAYFNDDEDDSHSLSDDGQFKELKEFTPPPKSLVDYPDDEEEIFENLKNKKPNLQKKTKLIGSTHTS